MASQTATKDILQFLIPILQKFSLYNITFISSRLTAEFQLSLRNIHSASFYPNHPKNANESRTPAV